MKVVRVENIWIDELNHSRVLSLSSIWGEMWYFPPLLLLFSEPIFFRAATVTNPPKFC